jgi:type II restriction/modification system DNA methylase subunit YeeA
MPITPQEFVAKWEKVDLKERSFYQEHFLDLCRLVGHDSPAIDDPTGKNFSFEAGAGRGFADVFKRSYFAWEYKGKHKDFNGAYDQLLRYREDLQNPPLLIVSDATLIRIHTNFTNTVKKTYELPIESLLDPENLAILKAAFFEPTRLKAPETPEMVTEKAAREFARLAEQLRKYGEDPTQIGHFLIRLLFCLFAEDVGLLPRDLFTRLVARTRRNSGVFKGQLQSLFGAMATGGWFGEHEITHFNGGLFDDDFVLELDSEGIEILVSVSGLDWSSIEPSILGTLFERSLDPNKRSQLGAHYTSRDDILLIVEPVLMQPLRRRWESVQEEARAIAAERDAASTPQKTRNRERDLANLLEAFAVEIREMRVLDPACGSGNFLYVALRQLLDLWKEVSTLASELGLPHLLPTSAPSPEQLFGIEINEYAHELAQATIWIGYIQWLRENGFGQPAPPILKALDNIKNMDAILTYDEAGNPIEPEWQKADVIIGNPPFLGGKKMRTELGDNYSDKLFELYRGKVAPSADLVCYWFERTRSYIEQNQIKRAGLLATNSIRSGKSRLVLENLKKTGDIFMAWDDKPWVLDGASVNISIIGFDNGSENYKSLNNSQVDNINSNLTAEINLTKAKKLPENSGICLRANEKGGSFDIEYDEAQKMLNAPINVNGRNNSDVLFPWIGGMDVVRGNRNKWIIDFGFETSQEEASLYEAPFAYAEKHIKPDRQKNRVERLRNKWWLHRVPAPAMRKKILEHSRYLVSPITAKHRVFIWVNNPTIPDITLAVFASDTDYFFGILHSSIHEIWSLATGTRLEDRPRYTPTTTFETFPFPWKPAQEPQDDPLVLAIAEAAAALNEKRERWLNPEGADEKELKKRTLTNLYNQRPTWLDLAHKKLDKAVYAAYGWAYPLSDEEILERLLALNLERAGA